MTSASTSASRHSGIIAQYLISVSSSSSDKGVATAPEWQLANAARLAWTSSALGSPSEFKKFLPFWTAASPRAEAAVVKGRTTSTISKLTSSISSMPAADKVLAISAFLPSMASRQTSPYVTRLEFMPILGEAALNLRVLMAGAGALRRADGAAAPTKPSLQPLGPFWLINMPGALDAAPSMVGTVAPKATERTLQMIAPQLITLLNVNIV
mmetsp:Transcript_124708/g.186294  ORF Transcript_124708/g.186294 Transcript_124708/m.186294 type:complete len:211 (+) Transcript_124708:182-814(+)